MALLNLGYARTAALLAIAGCYSPDLRDCTVSCATSDDCAGSQVCGTDHFCAVPAKAGTCASSMMADAGLPATDATAAGDAPPADAEQPDGPSLGALELVVMGHGQLVAGSHICSMDCTFMVALDPIEVVAVGSADQTFEKWTVGPCVGSQSTTCTATPPVTVGVKFHKADH